MKTAFTTEQIQDYLDHRIKNIERSAIAYQQVVLRVVDEYGVPTQDLDFDSMEDIEKETVSTTVTVRYNDKSVERGDLFVFRNITDEELAQLFIDTFVDAGLPDSDQSVYDIMSKLESQHNQPDTVVLVMNDGVIDSVATSKKIQVLVLDDDLEGLTDEEIEESAISISGSSSTYYVPSLHVKVDPAFTVDIHNRANKL